MSGVLPRIASVPSSDVLRASAPADRRSAAEQPAFSARPGAPLEPAVREVMESRLGHDFSTVRVHTDRDASDAARSVGAAALTHGREILFGASRYAPTTLAGQRLLAHELAHVAQQGGGGTRRTGADDAEREAADASVRVTQGQRTSVQSSRPVEVARAPEDDGGVVVKRYPMAKTDKPPKQRTYVKPPGPEDLPEDTHSITRSPPGARQPKRATVAGTWAHENFEKLESLLRDNAEKLTNEPVRGKEFKIPDPRVPEAQWQRIDRVDWDAAEIIEIKPEHLEAEGLAEAKMYADYMNRFYKRADGRLWKPRCATYSQAKVMRFLKEKGWFEPPKPKPRPKAKAKPKPKPKAKPKPEATAKPKAKPKPRAKAPPVEPPVESPPASPPVESTPAPPTVESTPAPPTVESTPAAPAVESTPASPPVESTAERVPAPGGGGLVGKVAGGAGYAGLFGEMAKDLHEGRVADAALAGGEAWALTRLGPRFAPPVMIGMGAYSTIMAYRNDPTIHEHAMAFGDWVAGSDQPSGLRQVAGGIAAAGEATGESIYKGVFKPVGTAIGEGAAALYLELTEPPAWAKEIEHEVQRRAWLHRQRELSVAREHKLEEAREEKDRAELAELQKSVREDRPLGTSGRVVTHASVGDGGRNDPADVHRIGARLHALGFLEATTDDPEEVADAIRMYQLAVLGQRHPTGRVRPGDATIRALSAGRKQSTMALP